MLEQIFSSNHVSSTQYSDSWSAVFKNYEHLCWELLDNWVDGILVLTETGQLIYSNLIAQKICAQLNPDIADCNIPKEIWQVLQALLRKHRSLLVRSALLTSEVWINRSLKLRIRVRQLTLQGKDNCILINLEDLQQASHDRVVSEVKQYGLTAREAEVWFLRRQGLSYREIAAQLYVAIDTVKKHLKSIYAKQRAYFDVAS